MAALMGIVQQISTEQDQHVCLFVRDSAATPASSAWASALRTLTALRHSSPGLETWTSGVQWNNRMGNVKRQKTGDDAAEAGDVMSDMAPSHTPGAWG